MIKQSLVMLNKVKLIDNFNDQLYFIFIVCQNFLTHADSGLAYRLQKEECRINN